MNTIRLPSHLQRLVAYLILPLAGGVSCAASQRVPACTGSCAPVGAGARVIPTRYSADRFFAAAVLPRGDTATFFLDTGSGSYIWDIYLPYLELGQPDTIVSARGTKVPVTRFPTLRDAQAIPEPIATPLQGQRLTVRHVDPNSSNNFIAWIARSTQGQLGTTWFTDRIWTFDYPSRRLLLHSERPPAAGRQMPLHFYTDSTGRRTSPTPYVDVVVDGDTIGLLIDTGASVWLSADALARVGDGKPSERGTSHIFEWVAAGWRERHPEWPVIEHADLYHDCTLIRVPNVSVAGYDLGPLWFSVWPGTADKPKGRLGMPLWELRSGGTLGGSLLRNFVVTLDYPRAIAWFAKPGAAGT